MLARADHPAIRARDQEKCPGTWQLIGGKEVHVSRKDGWNYVFTPTGTRDLLRVLQAKPGQDKQQDEIFQPVETGSSGSIPRE